MFGGEPFRAVIEYLCGPLVPSRFASYPFGLFAAVPPSYRIVVSSRIVVSCCTLWSDDLGSCSFYMGDIMEIRAGLMRMFYRSV